MSNKEKNKKTIEEFMDLIDAFHEENINEKEQSGLVFFADNDDMTIKSFGSIEKIMQAMVVAWQSHPGIGVIFDEIRNGDSWEFELLSKMPKLTRERKEQLEKNHWEENSKHENCEGDIIKITDLGAGIFIFDGKAQDAVVCKKCGEIGMRCAGKDCLCNQ